MAPSLVWKEQQAMAYCSRICCCPGVRRAGWKDGDSTYRLASVRGRLLRQ